MKINMATLQRFKKLFLFVYILAVLFISAFAKADVQITTFRILESPSLLLVEGTLSGCDINPRVIVKSRFVRNDLAQVKLAISTEASSFCENETRKFSVVADPALLADLKNVNVAFVFENDMRSFSKTVFVPNERTSFESNTRQTGVVVFVPAQMLGSFSKYVLVTTDKIFELNSFFDLSSYVGAPVDVEGYDLAFSVMSSDNNGVNGFLNSSDANKKLSSMFLSQISFVPLHKTQN